MNKSIKSPGLILNSDGHAMGQSLGLNGKHESNLSLMNMLKDQNKKAVHFAQVMAAKVDGIKRSFRSFIEVTGPLLDHEDTPALDPKLEQVVNEFIAVMEEQLSVGSLSENLQK